MSIHRLVFLVPLVFAMDASAADMARCGTDAFGNEVCMDKDGVLTNAPVKSGVDQTDTTDESGKAASGNSKRVRCGTDQFGNRVCSESFISTQE